MYPRALTLNEMMTYESVMEAYQNEIFGITEVHGLGIGYAHNMETLKLTSTIVLVVLVTPQYDWVNPAVKKKYGGLTTQVIQMPRLDEHSSKSISLPWEKRFQPVDPIVGGVQIGNSNLCKYKSGVLGAIVFDTTGDPLGLSVQHAIGDHQTAKSTDCDCPVCVNATQKTLGNKTSWWVPEASPGNVISQPNSFDSKNKIGELYKINRSLDAAIFKLNTENGSRRIEARVDGVPGELGEPTKPTLGTECLFRGAKTHTEGRIWFVGQLKTDHCVKDLPPNKFGRHVDKRIQIAFEVTGEHSTSGGDSGGLWITKEGLNPIGLHTAQVPSMGYPVATSIQQLVKEFHPFTFSPVQYQTMLENVSEYQTAFVDSPDDKGFFTFCVTTVGMDPVKIQKYDDRGKPVGATRSVSNIDALNGLSAACLNDRIYAVWRAMTFDEIKVSQWDRDGNLKSYYGLANFYSSYKPEIVHCGNRLVLAYVDRSFRLRLVVSDGGYWPELRYRATNGQSYVQFASRVVSAPALASMGNRLFVSWVEKKRDSNDRQIRLMEVLPNLNLHQTHLNSRVIHLSTLPEKYVPKGGVDLAVSTTTEELVLAMTTHGGALLTIATPLDELNRKNWTETNVLTKNRVTDNPPTLFCHDGRMICTRENASSES